MHGRIIGPILGSMAVAAVVAASFSASDGPSTNGTTDTPSITNDAASAASTNDEPFCPSAQEVRDHWDTYAEELKPDAGCPDLEPTAAEQAAQRKAANRTAHRQSGSGHNHHSHTHARPTLITSMRQAQDVLDPANDPLVLVDRDAQGRYLSIHITLAPGQASPPAWVGTADEFRQWLDERSTDQAEGSPR